jgi:hypothetical protein
VKRREQPEKHFAQIIVTEDGMQIIESEEQSENAESPIHNSVEPSSNVMLERDTHNEKQFAPRVSTLHGMQIDTSDEHSVNTLSSILDNEDSD